MLARAADCHAKSSEAVHRRNDGERPLLLRRPRGGRDQKRRVTLKDRTIEHQPHADSG